MSHASELSVDEVLSVLGLVVGFLVGLLEGLKVAHCPQGGLKHML